MSDKDENWPPRGGASPWVNETRDRLNELERRIDFCEREALRSMARPLTEDETNWALDLIRRYRLWAKAQGRVVP